MCGGGDGGGGGDGMGETTDRLSELKMIQLTLIEYYQKSFISLQNRNQLFKFSVYFYLEFLMQKLWKNIHWKCYDTKKNTSFSVSQIFHLQLSNGLVTINVKLLLSFLSFFLFFNRFVD